MVRLKDMKPWVEPYIVVGFRFPAGASYHYNLLLPYEATLVVVSFVMLVWL